MSEFNPSTGDKKVKKAKRIARMRGLKNFGWWLFGFLSSFLIVAGAAAICVCVIPVGTYFGQDRDKYVGEDVGNKTLLDIALHYQDYQVGDFPVVSELVGGLLENYDQYVTVDMEALNGISLGAFTGEGGEELSKILTEAIHVTATISSLGLTEMLGDLGNLSAMTEWTEVTESVNPDDEGFNAKLYYYKADEAPTYARAYTDTNPVELVPGATLPFYYPALVEVPILDMFDIMGERLSTTTITSLLSMFGEVDENGFVAKLLAGKTLGNVASITPADINLPDVLAVDGNESIYKILCSAAGVDYDELVAGNATLSVEQLTGLSLDGIKLVDVLEKTPENEKIFDLLVSAIEIEPGETRPDADNLTLGHLKALNVDNIKLSDVLPISSENQTIYDILSDATDTENENITIGSLSNISISNVKLTTIIPDDPAHADAWDAILALTGASSSDEVTIDNLQSTSLAGAKLCTFLKEDEVSESLMRLLIDGTGKGDLATIDAISDPTEKEAALKDAYCLILIDDLNALDINSIHLSSVLTLDDDNVLKKVLIQGIGPYESITLNDLSSLSFDAIKLSTVMPEAEVNSDLKNLLADATGSTYGNITINDLKNLDIQEAHISTILDLSSNPTLKNILIQGTGNASYDDIKIADLSTLDTENIKIATIMGDADAKLKNFLTQASGKSSWDVVTIGDITGPNFDINRVKIVTIMGTGNEKLLDILAEGCGVSVDNLTIGHASNDFEIANIKLQTIMSASDVDGNKILEALYNENPSITGLGTAMSNMTLFKAYGDTCFTKDSSKSVKGDRYRREVTANKVTYVLDNSGEYYVDKNSSVWLLFCFDVVSTNATNGVATTFRESTDTLDDLQNGSNASNAIMNAKIYQLIACGIMNDGSYSDAVLSKTLQELITAASVFIH